MQSRRTPKSKVMVTTGIRCLPRDFLKSTILSMSSPNKKSKAPLPHMKRKLSQHQAQPWQKRKNADCMEIRRIRQRLAR